MSTAQNISKVVADHAIVSVKFRQWSGVAKIRHEDLPDTGDLPPAEIATAGTIRLVDPASLRFAASLKMQVLRYMSGQAMPFLSGYLVRNDRLQAVDAQLGVFRAKLENDKAAFLDNLIAGGALRDWIGASGEWGQLIQSKLPADITTYLAPRFSLSWTVFNIDPVATAGTTLADLEEQINQSALEHMSRQIGNVFSDKARKRDLGARAASAINKLADSFDGMSMVNADVAVCQGILRQAAGHIGQGMDNIILAAIKGMSDVDTLVDLVEIAKSKGAASIFAAPVAAPVMPTPAPVAPVAAPVMPAPGDAVRMPEPPAEIPAPVIPAPVMPTPAPAAPVAADNQGAAASPLGALGAALRGLV